MRFAPPPVVKGTVISFPLLARSDTAMDMASSLIVSLNSLSESFVEKRMEERDRFRAGLTEKLNSLHSL